MRYGIIASILVICLSPPLHAGQLVITETDTAIIVEYTGDPAETRKTVSLEEQPAFKKLMQLAGHTPSVVTATNVKDNTTQEEEKKRVFEAARKRAEEARSHKWSGKTAQERYE